MVILPPPPQMGRPVTTSCHAVSCRYYLYKVGAKSGDPISSDNLVMLESKAYTRYCGITVDGELLCVSSQMSNATRNLFTLGLLKDS